MSKLRQRATAGFFWSAIERFGQQLCAFGVQLVLARILEPEQFGLMAMLLVFIAISGVIVDSGLGAAIIQKDSVSESDLSVVFIFSLIASVALSGALWVAAPYVAWFYERPELAAYLRVLGFGLVFGSIGSVPTVILRRELGFKKLFMASAPATLLSGVIGIAMALGGYGMWSLVAQVLSLNAIGSLVLWLQTEWRPSLTFDPASLRSMLPYGSRLAASQLLDRGFQNLYVLVIGKTISPVEVGYFQRAYSFQQLPMSNLQVLIGNVSFPLLSSIQREPARLRYVVKASLQLAGLLSFTTMAVMAALAEPMVRVLLGEKWLPCVPMLRLLCVVGALYPLHATNLTLLQALGRSDLFLRLEIIKKTLTLASIAITYRFGVQALIAGMMVTSVLALALNTHYTRKLLNYGFGAQLLALLPAIALALFLFSSVTILNHAVSLSPPLQLLVFGAWSAVALFAALRFMPETAKHEIRELLGRVSLGARLANVTVGAGPATKPASGG